MQDYSRMALRILMLAFVVTCSTAAFAVTVEYPFGNVLAGSLNHKTENAYIEKYYPSLSLVSSTLPGGYFGITWPQIIIEANTPITMTFNPPVGAALGPYYATASATYQNLSTHAFTTITAYGAATIVSSLGFINAKHDIFADGYPYPGRSSHGDNWTIFAGEGDISAWNLTYSVAVKQPNSQRTNSERLSAWYSLRKAASVAKQLF